MTNKLTKKSSNPLYGDDINALLKKEKIDGLACEDLETRVLAKYLNDIRHMFETDTEIRGILIKANPTAAAKEDILSALEWLRHPDTPELFEKAVNILLQELQDMRNSTPGAYLIDRSSGMPIKKLEDGDIFQPPDYIDDNGNRRQSLKKVHPKISASVTIEKVNFERQKELNKKIEDPKYKYALAHLKNPDEIMKRARSLLEKQGVKFEEMDGPNFEIIEFGREHVNGEDQSINPAFHRLGNHASILAIKVLKLVKSGDLCWLGNLSVEKSSKQKWYTVQIWTKFIHQLN